jgi:SAM-dependent MidA family methyltransferase
VPLSEKLTPAGELLVDEIHREGPIPFRRFMEVALYHPEHSYYRRNAKTRRDPFGKSGDFFTAEQLQPVFGWLIAARVRELWRQMGSPAEFTVVELGAGRNEMAESFGEWRHIPVEVDGTLPTEVRGVVFSNEFFDSLPVDAVLFMHGEFRRELVAWNGGRFVWSPGDLVSGDLTRYLGRFFPPPVEGQRYEVNLEALVWIERIGRMLHSGWVVTIDYGFTRAEAVRFPTGTLMGYHRHTAREGVLAEPGARDITAHVNFTALAEHGADCGLRAECFETLAQALMGAGAGEIARVLAATDAKEQLRRRLQLKTLLFGMGETFRVLWQRKEGEEFGGKSL